MATAAFVLSVSNPAYDSTYFFALMSGTGLGSGGK
jgi:hypothetical protein